MNTDVQGWLALLGAASAPLLRFAFDLGGMLILIFGMFYHRYRDKELATAAALFNVFSFAVLTILSSVDFGLAAGFGLFAVLALFTLRSEPLSKTEMTYFFGSIAVAVICSIEGTTQALVGTMIAFVLLGAWVLDHPRLLKSVAGARVSLDRIPEHLLADPAAVRRELSERLGVEVMSFQVLQLDYITEMARLNVFYRTR